MLSIDSVQLQSKIAAGNPLLLIDVRQPEELLHGTLEGAYSFPLSEITMRIVELETLVREHKGEIVIFCRSGGRSEQVINFLEGRGAPEMANLVGGTNDYSKLDDRIGYY
jgi:rhodanese-related sulfurtransferase